MTVVHFVKISVLYPRVVISSLAMRLKKPPFCHSYTSFGARHRDDYMSLQRFTIGRMPGLAKVACSTIALLRFPMMGLDDNYANSGIMTPLAPCEPGRVTMPIFHSFEQGTLPTASLISKHVVPYWIRGGTCCPGVSTPKTRSLADLSMINHTAWRISTVSTIPNLAQTTASSLTTVTSHHDRWKTNTLNTQHKSNSTL
jgi:hypothetical protein